MWCSAFSAEFFDGVKGLTISGSIDPEEIRPEVKRAYSFTETTDDGVTQQ